MAQENAISSPVIVTYVNQRVGKEFQANFDTLKGAEMFYDTVSENPAYTDCKISNF